jgi:hypothetical protein
MQLVDASGSFHVFKVKDEGLKFHVSHGEPRELYLCYIIVSSENWTAAILRVLFPNRSISLSMNVS